MQLLEYLAGAQSRQKSVRDESQEDVISYGRINKTMRRIQKEKLLMKVAMAD